MKGQHDVFERHACFEQCVSDGAIGAVVLNPDFAINDVEINDRTVNAPYALSADVQDFEMIAVSINDLFSLDDAVHGRVLVVLLSQTKRD
jgi:hypothetical protein